MILRQANHMISSIMITKIVRRIWSAFFFVVCATGFLYQLHQVSKVYFSYRTTSRINLVINKLEHPATVVFCSRYNDLIDRRQHKKYGIHPKMPTALSDIIAEQSRLSIKDIFELTPGPNQILESCIIREAELEIPNEFNSTECFKLLKILKTVHGEHVCYFISSQSSTSYSPSNIASSLNFIGVVYDVELSSHLSSVTSVTLITYIPRKDPRYNWRHDWPLVSRLFAGGSSILNGIGNTRFFLYYQQNEIQNLPPPFDTDCLVGHKSHECYEGCLSQEMAKVKRVSWSAFLDEPVDLVMMTHKDLENRTMANFTKKAMNHCHEMCTMRNDCFSRFSRSKVSQGQGTTRNRTRISSMVAFGTDFNVRAIPLLSLVEFVVQVGSCLGAWFGLSIFSMNPANFLLKKNMNKHRPELRRFNQKSVCSKGAEIPSVQ